MSVALPRAVSRTLTRAKPVGGMREGAKSSGNPAQSAVRRSESGQGRRASHAANIANGYHHQGGAARHDASSRSAAQTMLGQHPSYTCAAAPKNQWLNCGAIKAESAP